MSGVCDLEMFNKLDELSELGVETQRLIGKYFKNDMIASDFLDDILTKMDEIPELDLPLFKERLRMVSSHMHFLDKDQLKAFDSIVRLNKERSIIKTDSLELVLSLVNKGDTKYFEDMLRMRHEMELLTDISHASGLRNLDTVFAESLRSWKSNVHGSMGHLYAVRKFYKTFDNVDSIIMEYVSSIDDVTRRVDCIFNFSDGRRVSLEVKAYLNNFDPNLPGFSKVREQIFKDVAAHFDSNFENLVWMLNSRHSDKRDKLIRAFKTEIESDEFEIYIDVLNKSRDSHSKLDVDSIMRTFDSRLSSENPPFFMTFEFGLVD